VDDLAILTGDFGAEDELVLFPLAAEGADLALEFLRDEEDLVLEAIAPAGVDEMVTDVGKSGHGWPGEITRGKA
jgi:hypothetical protein